MLLKKTIWTVVCLLVAFTLKAQTTASASQNPEQLIFDVASLEKANHIEIYPNPSIDFIVVEIKNSELSLPEIEVRSVIGNKLDVSVEEFGHDKFKINVKDFAAGYYFVVVSDDPSHFKEAFKFLKK